ncbi:hypothetical protein HDR66_03775, partial [bacterium]|nr:hypothetical protein [bacterium]
MYKLPKFLFRCSLVALAPIAANAAGTYYTGNYQSPQQRYSNQSYSSASRGATYSQNGVTYNRVGTNNATGGYNNSSYASTRYNQNQQGMRGNNVSQNNQGQPTNSGTSKVGEGFTLGGGISRESAMWRFEMKESDSILRFDDISWNVLDLHGAYDFNVGNTMMRVNAGFKYGMQAGDGSMTDDDITNGGYFVTRWYDETAAVIGDQIGHSLSIGTAEGGNMYGFNFGVGLVDVFKVGNLKMTPSVGYRYFKYKLENKKNYGLAVETAQCFNIDGSDEVQCDPILIIHYPDGKTVSVEFRDDINILPQIPSGAAGGSIDAAGTYYYQQPGVSHSYEVSWSGPYVAM